MILRCPHLDTFGVHANVSMKSLWLPRQSQDFKRPRLFSWLEAIPPRPTRFGPHCRHTYELLKDDQAVWMQRVGTCECWIDTPSLLIRKNFRHSSCSEETSNKRQIPQPTTLADASKFCLYQALETHHVNPHVRHRNVYSSVVHLPDFATQASKISALFQKSQTA